MNAPVLANCRKRVRPGRRLSLRQVLDFQNIAHEAAVGLRSDFLEATDREERARVASAISNLAKGWVSLQDSKREILGKPRAGVRKHAVERPKPKPPRVIEPTIAHDAPPAAGAGPLI